MLDHLNDLYKSITKEYIDPNFNHLINDLINTPRKYYKFYEQVDYFISQKSNFSMMKILSEKYDHLNHWNDDPRIIEDIDGLCERYEIENVYLKIDIRMNKYFVWIISQIFIHKYYDVDMGKIFCKKYTLRYFNEMVDKKLTSGKKEKIIFNNYRLTMSILIDNCKIISWRVNGEEQDVNDEAYMLHCYFSIICNIDTYRSKSARF